MTNRTAPVPNSSYVPAAPDENAHLLPDDFFIVAVVFLSAQIAVGLPGNLKVFLLLQKKKSARKVPEVLLWNLSLVGVLVSGVYVPLFLTFLVANQFSVKSVPFVFGIVRFSLSVSLSCWQSLNLVAMAVDRYDGVLHPHKSRITSANVFKVVRGIWVIVGLIMATHGALAGRDILESEVTFQLPNTVPSMLFTLVLVNSLLLVTVAVILITFVRIVKRLRSSPFPESYKRPKIRLITLTYTVLFAYFISLLPLIVIVIVGRLIGLSEASSGALRLVLVAVSNTNYVVNPFIHVSIVNAARRRAAPRSEIEQRDANDLELSLRATKRTQKPETSNDRMDEQEANNSRMNGQETSNGRTNEQDPSQGRTH